MIIERFRDQDAVSVYALVGDADRGIHEGLRYIDGWIEPNFDRCFQLMECDDLRLLHQWVLHWRELGTFEIVPVVGAKETRETVAPFLPSHRA